ncbi:hypothetical protein [Ramlibacter sp.]|uniref:hypothetical protein n=1 Tax=Ramlibacter sp. TaxID=1917967 RepID=UPI002FCAD7F3
MSPVNLEVKTDWDSHERSVGPVKGYYLALCACETAEGPGRFVGYYKVCTDPPAGYWEAAGLLKGCTDPPRRHAHLALRDAEQAARQEVGRLPATGGAGLRQGPVGMLEDYLLGLRRGRV